MLGGLGSDRDPVLRRRVCARRDRLGEQGDRVAARERERELAGVDADDIDQISDEAIHAGDVAGDARQAVERAPALGRLGGLLGEDRHVHCDAAEQVPQVVADHPHRLVAMRERAVGGGLEPQ